MENTVRISTVDEYIALQPKQMRPTLEKLRQIIKLAEPNAEEKISYRMPLFKFHGMLAYFCLHTNHYGIYVSPDVLQAFKEKLANYKLAKATIRLPFDEPVPEKLITEIIKYAAKSNIEKERLKKASKSKK